MDWWREQGFLGEKLNSIQWHRSLLRKNSGICIHFFTSRECTFCMPSLGLSKWVNQWNRMSWWDSGSIASKHWRMYCSLWNPHHLTSKELSHLTILVASGCIPKWATILPFVREYLRNNWCMLCKYFQRSYSWWFQPIWKMLVKLWIISPKIRVKITNTTLKTNIKSWKIPIFYRRYIDSFMAVFFHCY